MQLYSISDWEYTYTPSTGREGGYLLFLMRIIILYISRYSGFLWMVPAGIFYDGSAGIFYDESNL